MKSEKTVPKPIRSYAPNKAAMARLIAHGILGSTIYQAEKDQHWTKFNMREGEYLGVVDGLRAFGGKRDIAKAVKKFHDQGATIIDVETGRDSRKDGVIMHAEATGPKRLSAEAERLLRDQRLDERRAKNGKLKKHDAHRIWHKDGLSIEEKAEITGWAPSTLHAIFGKSGAPAGRRPKHQISL